MKRQLRRTAFLLALLSMTGCGLSVDRPGSDPSAVGTTQNVVRQVDHILIESSDANSLFSLLTDTLQLPVAWPMSDYGGFTSGGVAVGNVNLEVLTARGPGLDDRRSRFTGFALEPEPLRSSLPELDARGIRRGQAAPFRSTGSDGSATTLWTTVALPSVSDDVVEVFLCEYGHDVAATRRQTAEQLRSRNGGPLSVLSVTEIVYGATDAPGMQRQWQALLSPLEPSSPGVWSVGAGPAIRINQASENGIQEIVVSVQSLPEARQFLEQRGLLRMERSVEITLGGPVLEGLTITLVQGSGVQQRATR